MAALFVLVVVAALGAYALSIAGTQQRTSALGVWGARADLAARAGVQWAVADIVNNGGASLSCALGSVSSGSVSLNLTQGALAGFDVVVECTTAPITEGAASYSIYQLTVTATRGALGSLDHVSRRRLVTVAD